MKAAIQVLMLVLYVGVFLPARILLIAAIQLQWLLNMEVAIMVSMCVLVGVASYVLSPVACGNLIHFMASLQNDRFVLVGVFVGLVWGKMLD